VTRSQRAAETRRRILEAGAVLFDQHGYLGTSMNDLLRASDSTKGSFYFHFPSKEALAVAIVQDHYSVWPDLVARVEANRAPAITSMIAITMEVAERFRDDVAVRAAVRLSFERDQIKAPLPIPFVFWVEQLTVLFRRSRTEGDLPRSIDPELASRTMVGAFFGIQHMSAVLNSRRDVLERLREMWQLLLPALAPGSTVRAQWSRAEAIRRRGMR
jgi:AcrR family transcriptional regulator